jgi:hypothetical protein
MTNLIEKRLEIEQKGYKPYSAKIYKKMPSELELIEVFNVLTYSEASGKYQEHLDINKAYWGEGSSIVGYSFKDDNSNDNNNDIINPNHYRTIPAGNYPNGIQYMGIVAFLLENKKDALDHYEAHIYSQIMKYSLRLGEKDATLQDMKKVKWYVDLFLLYNEVKEGTKDLKEFVADWEIVKSKVEKQ